MPAAELKRLPKGALLVEFGTAFAKICTTLLPGLIAILAKGEIDWVGLGILAIVPFAAVYSLLHHHRFRYGIEGENVVVHSGVVWRRKRELPIVRIHALSTSISPLTNSLGLSVFGSKRQAQEVRTFESPPS